MMFIKHFGSVIISLIGAGAIVVTALVTQDTNPDAWWYPFFAWMAASFIFERRAAAWRHDEDK